MGRFHQFNTLRALLVTLTIAWVTLGAAPADEIRKWRDADGNLHYSIDGSQPTGGEPGATASDEPPVVQTREVSPEEKFSVDVSLKRRQIETDLRAAARALEATRKELAEAEARRFQAWVPTSQASIDVQRDAFLAATQFEEEKAERLRRLHRQKRTKLREIIRLWKDFTALDSVVTERYGSAPDWWRKRLDCGGCPPLAQAEAALRGPEKSPTPSAATASSDDEDWEEEDDEDWQ